ncbi:MAG: hypothetical protein E7404_01960 [Ruminococcaceae bacterium]|nr:hypothetical protein [Oscillospiraceae bacterium]
MKNIFTRALALTLVFALCAVSAFAAPDFTSVEYDKTAGTLDIVTEGYTAGKSATVLVVKDGADLANLSNTDIVYIDQIDNAVAAQSYTDIPIAERAEAIGADAINVYIGGSEVTAAIPYGVDDGEGNIVPTVIAVAEEEPTPVTYTYTATFNTASSEFASVDAAIAALVVTKNGSDGSTATLTAADYTTDTTVANTIKVLVAGAEVASVAYTIVVPVTYTYTVAFNTASSEFASVDAAIAALVVTKNGSDGSTATLTAADYTTDTATAGTIKVLVAGAEVGSVTYTIADVGGDEPAKTAIAGTVKRLKSGNPDAAKGATILITKGTTVVGVAYAGDDGSFEIEVPADTGYRAIINFIRFTSSNTYATYVPQVIKDITVTEGATTTIKSTGLDYVYCGDVLAGDLDGDGDVDGDDYGTLAGNWTGKIN